MPDILPQNRANLEAYRLHSFSQSTAGSGGDLLASEEFTMNEDSHVGNQDYTDTPLPRELTTSGE